MDFEVEKLYRLLRAINQIILKSMAIQEGAQDYLFRELCDTVAKYFVKFSWIGLYKDGKIIPVYHPKNIPNEYKDYMRFLEIPVDESDIRSKGPAVTCFKENKVVLIEDISKDLSMEFWRQEALKRGFQSSATIPIRKNGKVIGVFGMYAGEVDFFQEEERSLLEELSYDIELALNETENVKFIKSIESALSKFIDVFIITDEDYNISYMGQKTLGFFGYKEDEVLGKSIEVLRGIAKEDDLFKITYGNYHIKIKESL